MVERAFSISRISGRERKDILFKPLLECGAFGKAEGRFPEARLPRNLVDLIDR